MLQRMPKALAQVKACITSEALLYEIIQIIHSLYQAEFNAAIIQNGYYIYEF